MQANLALARQQLTVKRAQASVREARGRYLPSVAANARYSKLDGVVDIGDFINPAYAALNQLSGQPNFPTDVTVTLPFRQETKLELIQPIFNDALFGATAAAQAQQALVGANRRVAVRQLATAVQQTWLGYASAVRIVETLEATLPVLQENIRVSERLVDAGRATPDIVLRARAEFSELLGQLSNARAQRDAARRSFNTLRNTEIEAEIQITEDDTLLPSDTLPLAALVEHALRYREELQQAESGIRMAEAQRRIARAGMLPAVALSASYGIQGDEYRFDQNNDVAMLNLVFSWNFFNGGQDVARREQALLARDEAISGRQETIVAIRVDVANAYDAMRTARLALEAAVERNVSAERAFVLVERRFAEGVAPQIEFISARASYTSAALNEVIARYTVAARAVDLERAAALRQLDY